MLLIRVYTVNRIVGGLLGIGHKICEQKFKVASSTNDDFIVNIRFLHAVVVLSMFDVERLLFRFIALLHYKRLGRFRPENVQSIISR